MPLSTLSEAGDDQYILVASLDNVRNLSNILKAISFKDHALFNATPNGLKVTVEDSKCLQANAFIQAEIFQEYTIQEDSVSFQVNLTVLLDCLTIFGGNTGPGGTTALRLCYNGYGYPLTLFLEEGGVVTVCKINTEEPEEPIDFEFCSTDVTNKVILQSDSLRDAFSELDMTSEILQITMSPSQPFFRLSTFGNSGNAHYDYPKDSDMMELFQCTKTQTNRYKMSLLKPSTKALALSCKVSVRTDNRGFLSLQYLTDISEEDPKNDYNVPAPVSVGKWKNKERVLVFSSRGISFRTRHLMQDLRTMMPHTKADTKMDRKDKLFVINEVCEIKNCNKCIYFEAKKKQDLYMWISNVPHGPSAKFLVQNIHTLAELKMTGNCLKGSRPLLSFDPNFDKDPHYALLKELFTQIFATPQYHPRSQPFVDHVFTFTIADNRIWFRNYQIIEEDASLVEIGPRFVLNLIKIFQGSFGGPTLYENPHFQSPNMHRRIIRLATAAKLREKQMVKELQKMKRLEEKEVVTQDVTDDVFATPSEEKPIVIQHEAPPLKKVKKKKNREFKRQRVQKLKKL
ncbi:hypothetical protein SKAU_G00357620 [Synaphobranchus kaupii]|uniref:Cell cycle checkpoint protein RAD1 n=1 Tax=Synaphobranchus kaupii TaxID=118154 RepID=A0A9Q1EHM0_SYNKA|nr:hypothetical protein SKAU_G00357620 [Synaphobranchus kaupii]